MTSVSARNERDPNPANNQASASETPIPPSPPVVVTGRIIVEKVTNPSDDTHRFTYSASFGDFELTGQQFTTRDQSTPLPTRIVTNDPRADGDSPPRAVPARGAAVELPHSRCRFPVLSRCR